MVEEYRLEVKGQPYLILHGDRFDPTLRYPMVTEVAGFCYQLTTKLNKKLAKWLKKKSKRWGGVLEFVRNQAVALARKEKNAGIIAGHTHFAEDSLVEDVHYVNTGCWTEYPCSYVTRATASWFDTPSRGRLGPRRFNSFAVAKRSART